MASIIVLAVVFVLDVLAFVLAIGAEKRRNTAAYVNVDQNARPYCVYGSDAATGYGIGALVLLLAAQAVIMAATRCFCCGRALSPGRWRAFSGFCFIACCEWLHQRGHYYAFTPKGRLLPKLKMHNELTKLPAMQN